METLSPSKRRKVSPQKEQKGPWSTEVNTAIHFSPSRASSKPRPRAWEREPRATRSGRVKTVWKRPDTFQSQRSNASEPQEPAMSPQKMVVKKARVGIERVTMKKTRQEAIARAARWERRESGVIHKMRSAGVSNHVALNARPDSVLGGMEETVGTETTNDASDEASTNNAPLSGSTSDHTEGSSEVETGVSSTPIADPESDGLDSSVSSPQIQAPEEALQGDPEDPTAIDTQCDIQGRLAETNVAADTLTTTESAESADPVKSDVETDASASTTLDDIRDQVEEQSANPSAELPTEGVEHEGTAANAVVLPRDDLAMDATTSEDGVGKVTLGDFSLSNAVTPLNDVHESADNAEPASNMLVDLQPEFEAAVEGNDESDNASDSPSAAEENDKSGMNSMMSDEGLSPVRMNILFAKSSPTPVVQDSSDTVPDFTTQQKEATSDASVVEQSEPTEATSMTPDKEASDTVQPFAAPSPRTAIEVSHDTPLTPSSKTTKVQLNDDDDALLRDFLSRSKASKAARIAKRSSQEARRDSDAVKTALASPAHTRIVLEDLDTNSPSPHRSSVTGEASQKAEKSAGSPLQRVVTNPSSTAPDEDSDELSHLAQMAPRRSKRGPKPVVNEESGQQQGTNTFSIRRPEGTGAILNKSETQQLATITRTNTRRNKGGALPPSSTLMKLQSQAQDETVLLGTPVHPEGRRGVRWNEDLVSFYEGGKDELVLEVTAVPTVPSQPLESATVADGGPSTTTTKPRAKRARALGGMNGTPAKVKGAKTSLLAEAEQEADAAAATTPAASMTPAVQPEQTAEHQTAAKSGKQRRIPPRAVTAPAAASIVTEMPKPQLLPRLLTPRATPRLQGSLAAKADKENATAAGGAGNEAKGEARAAPAPRLPVRKSMVPRRGGVVGARR